MHFFNFIKKHKISTSLFLVPIIISIVCLMLVSCAAGDNMKYSDAIAIAKRDFGCEKILWIGSDAEILSAGKTENNKIRSPYSYYVVGEINGEEVYIMIPSNTEKEKPFITEWSLDYSFAQIVEKVNESGAQYVADVPDDYYSLSHDKYINLHVGLSLNGLADYYEIGVDDNTFYERLDVKAVFEYTWKIEETEYRCIVTQESGELKAYKKVEVIYTPIG